MEQYKKNVAWEEEKRQQKVKDSTDKSLAAIEKAKKDSAQAQHDREVNAAIDKEEARKAAALKKKYGAAAYAKAEKGTPWIGMPEELVEVAVGTPSNKNTSNTAQGKQEEWLYYYNDDMIWTHRIVLRNHVVTAIYSRE